MNIVRKLRKRFTRHTATSDDICSAFQSIMGRPASHSEISRWSEKYLTKGALERRLAVEAAKMSTPPRGGETHQHLAGLTNEDYVEYVYLIISGRFPSPAELQNTAKVLRKGATDRTMLLLTHFAEAAREETARRSPPKSAWQKLKSLGDGPAISVMGTPQKLTKNKWQNLVSKAETRSPSMTHARFPLQPRKSNVDVSVLCSLWRGGDFIERYMENITSQTIFSDRCELIVVDAASPEGESDVIKHYIERFGDRIVYHRMPYRAGIYAAWNYGVGVARGRYLTNANLDDLRRVDSLERQSAALDALSFVDVVYDDHLYFCDPDADYDLIQRVGALSELPLATRTNMFYTNPPHNGPMWRAKLHEKIGQFDETYRSAGDYEFWLRALIDGATFYKLNEPTVAYYFNPTGLSTAEGGVGVLEARRVLRKHGAQLIPEAARESHGAFLKRVGLTESSIEGSGSGSRYRLVQQRMRDLARLHAPERSGR